MSEAARQVGIVGAGLIGASIGMALRAAGCPVLLRDIDDERVALAARLGAGQPWPTGQRVDHLVVAVPPRDTAAVLHAAQREQLAGTYSDVSSVKVRVYADAAAAGADLTSFCGAHPMAGGERNGPVAARADLFAGRAWVLCPSADTAVRALADARAIAEHCRATPVELAAEAHDEAVAAVSHVPQLVASLLAARLVDLPEASVGLAGQGLRDMLRIASSHPQLWAEVVAANAAPVRAVLAGLAADLAGLRAALDQATDARPEPAGAAVTDLLARGNAGRARLPGKHGSRATFTAVAVVVDDRPGTLARLFADVAEIGVNVEDLGLEHALGRPVGVAEVLVAPAAAARLLTELTTRGWPAHLS